jgi:hypothetical protein
VKDAQGNLVQGRTRWRRFAAVMLPAAAAAGVLMAGVANGAVPVAFNVSGQTFKVAASKLVGEGFSQYGGVVLTKDKTAIPVAASGIASADLYDLCQSVTVPNTPLSLVIRAGGNNKPAHADNLLIGMTHLQGDATFQTIDIGQDASTLTKGGADAHGDAGMFGQQADSVTIDNLKQTAYSTHAGTFVLNGLDLHISMTGEECFPG